MLQLQEETMLKLNSPSESQPEIPKELSGLFRRHYDQIVIDSSLKSIDKILAVMYLLEKKNKKAGIEYDKIRSMILDSGMKDNGFRAYLHRAKENALIMENNRRFYFLGDGLKRIENILGQSGKVPVKIIKSGQHLTAVKLFEEFLHQQSQNQDILLCDPCISADTLHPFSGLKDKIKSLKILTTNICYKGRFENYKNKLEKELGIEVSSHINSRIHDRFIIFGDSCWSIGSSIKDLGNKDTLITEIPDVAISMKQLFMDRWMETK